MCLCISRSSLLMRCERKRLKRWLLIYWRCVKAASETPLNNLHSSSAFDQLKVTGRYCTRWPITALRLVIFAHIQHGVKLAWVFFFFFLRYIHWKDFYKLSKERQLKYSVTIFCIQGMDHTSKWQKKVCEKKKININTIYSIYSFI